ncbi:MAG: spore cortex biosynthesis protein YabQ [Clostridia bacterium]|nr:spore cortex biosynthesis protein YabQ [Clostridia bacterium]
MAAFRNDFQIDTFIYMLYAGCLLSLIYDAVTHLFCRQRLLFRLIADLMLSVITAFALFLAVYHSGSGSLRFFMLFAFLLGMLLYRISIGSIAKSITKHFNKKRKNPARGE